MQLEHLWSKAQGNTLSPTEQSLSFLMDVKSLADIETRARWIRLEINRMEVGNTWDEFKNNRISRERRGKEEDPVTMKECYSELVNSTRGKLPKHENRAQETLHLSNDDITKESNPKNLSVPTNHQSNRMLNNCTATAVVQRDKMSWMKMRDAQCPLVFYTANIKLKTSFIFK